jgi:serine protease Do
MDHVADASVGESMKIAVMRNGKKEDLSVIIGDRAKVFANTFGKQGSEATEPGEGTQAKFGIFIQDLNASLRQNLNYNGPAGVLITQVEGGSFADDIGLLQNDIIVQINRQPVTSAEELKRIQNTMKPGDAVVFKIMRAGRGNQTWTPSFVPGTLPAAGQ